MDIHNESTTVWKVNYNVEGKKYYVLTEYSGLPAADFYYKSQKIPGGLVIPRDKESSADFKY